MDPMPTYAAWSVGDVAHELDVDPLRGLAAAEAARRLDRDGPNRPWRAPPASLPALLLRQLADPLVVLLLAASTLSAAIGQALDAVVIGVIVVLNAGLGAAQAMAAERAVIALRDAFGRGAAVVRDGRRVELDAAGVVVGDVLSVEEGDRVAADARIVEARGLRVDESALTGESGGVAKSADAVGADTSLADRSSMLHAGTGITRGHGRAIVVATADATELGAVARLAATARPPATPLQRELGGLARWLAIGGAVLAPALAAVLVAQGEQPQRAFLVGVAVAVAAVPEGLLAIVTTALALGARTMAESGAVVRRLDAIEAIGHATVICADKTGTLTLNRLEVVRTHAVDGAPGDVLAAALAAAGSSAGADPVDAAIRRAAEANGAAVDPSHVLVHEQPFDAELRHAAAAYRDRGGVRTVVKGAPEVVLGRCEGAAGLARLAEGWAAEGLKVLAVAERRDATSAAAEPRVRALRPLGLLGFEDPLRPGAAEAVAAARAGGVRVVMVTGDHEQTAHAIARRLGIAPVDVRARVAPAEKLAIVRDLQAAGEVVVVTGDGVNDAPALRRADVGIAMGEAGTEVAREAAAIVLTDDAFPTVVAALREGRRIRDDVHKATTFLLSANLGEVLLFTAAIVAGLGAPMTVTQVLLVNLLTDGLPALALCVDPAVPATRAGRAGGRLSTGVLALAAALVALAGVAAFLVGRSVVGDAAAGRSLAFAVVAGSELLLAYALRSPEVRAWRRPRNRLLAAATALSGLVIVAAVLAPLPGSAAPGPAGWIAIAALVPLPAAGVELAKAIVRRRCARGAAAPRRGAPAAAPARPAGRRTPPRAAPRRRG
jgi:Ca2+-transporting ATPase